MSANDLNLCQFIGRLGADPDMRYTPSGAAVANMRLACNWKGRDTEGTEWVSLVAFERLAEICGQYLKKGSQVYVAGRIRTRKWQDRNGADRYSTEVVLDTMQMLGGAREAGEPQRPARPLPSGKEAAAEQAAPIDDDIPF